MALYDLYSHPQRKIYKSSLCSKAAFFQLVTFVLTVICPLLIAYRSQGFWIKLNRYKESPDVRFKYEYLFYMQSERPDLYWLWTSFPGLMQLEDSRLRAPVLRVYEMDEDRDGKMDYAKVTVTFPMAEGERVHAVNAILIFDYKLNLYSRFKMETMIHVRHESLIEGTVLAVNGDMKFVQKTPLLYRGIDNRFDAAVVNSTSLNAADYRLPKILNQYQQRNISTKLEPVAVDWTPGSAGAMGQFQLTIRVAYAADTYEYYTGFWELIKWAWIQYLSILLVFIFLMNRLKEYVFRNRLVATVSMADESKTSSFSDFSQK